MHAYTFFAWTCIYVSYRCVKTRIFTKIMWSTNISWASRLGPQCRTLLRPYSLSLMPIDSWLFTLDPYPSSLISDPFSLPVVPYPSPSTVPFKKIQGGGSPFFIHWRLSAIEGRLTSKVGFHRKLSSTEGHPPQKLVFHWRLSSTEGHLHQGSSSTEGHLSLKVVFHRRLSSTKGCPPPTITA